MDSVDPAVTSDIVDASERSQHPELGGRETDASVRREIDHIKHALRLLGLQPCATCKIFFRTVDPGTLFRAGEAVCFRCLPEWWDQKRPQISSEEREKIEHKLVRWLVQHHGAYLITDPKKLTDNPDETRIIASCLECQGTGNGAGATCRRCCGGNLWVVMKHP